MKKKIEAELLRIAEEIISNKGKLNSKELKKKAQALYEKLSILAFTEEYLNSSMEELEENYTEEIEKSVMMPTYDEFYPDGTEYNEDSDAITEPNTEKIKDIVAQMPPETEKVDSLIENINTAPEPRKTKEKPREEKKDFRNIGVDYDNLPDFEPVNHVEKNNKPRSLNDRLKKGINIGLNDRLAFIRHLFDGKTADYNRVLSQLNTFSSLEEARKFIDKVVKPDYNHWEGKEEHEERFMNHIENKFSK